LWLRRPPATRIPLGGALKGTPKTKSDEILEIVAGVIGSSLIFIENRAAVMRAVATARQYATDFADVVIAASAFAAGCDTVLTFDRGAQRAGMAVLE
jgi:predicted nucleic-acid-binding protein